MAVSEIKLLAAGASGSATGTDPSNESVSYSLTYQVKCDNQSDGCVTVMDYFRTHADYPWLGRTFKFGNDFDTDSVCKSVKPSYIENSGGIFLVPCEFSPVDSSDNQQQTQSGVSGKATTDPLQWHDEISVSFGTYSAPVESAILMGALNAKTLSPHLKVDRFLPVTNSKLEPLDPSFEEEYAIKTIRITKNVMEYDDDFYNKYHDTINSSEITIDKPEYRFKATIGKHYGRLRVSGDFQITNGIIYYRRTLEYAIKGWNRPILDQTHVYSEILRESDVKRDGTTVSASDLPSGYLQMEVPVKDDDGLSPSRPMLLNGDGKQLKEGEPPVSLVWRSVEEADHSGIDW